MIQTCWRDTARTVRIAFLDARALSGFFVWMLHMCWPTFWISLLITALFLALERWGLTLPAALRLARTACFADRRSHESMYVLRCRTRL